MQSPIQLTLNSAFFLPVFLEASPSLHPLSFPFFTVNEALCISMATASASWGFALKWEAGAGGEDTLSAALQTGKRKHSHVMMEFAPSLSPPPSLCLSPSFPRLAGRTIARWAAAPPHAPAHLERAVKSEQNSGKVFFFFFRHHRHRDFPQKRRRRFTTTSRGCFHDPATCFQWE